MTLPLLLCSASPRRRDLLAGLGLRFTAVAPDVDERRRPAETAAQLPERLARDKALAGLALHRAAEGERTIALAADTVVAKGEEDFGKPRDRDDAERMLSRLSGTEHQVITGVAVIDAQGVLRSCRVTTRVRFRALSPEQLAWLAASGDGDDKAGGYAVQGLAGAFIESIQGSPSNVVGLPLAETLELLERAGFLLPWQRDRDPLPGHGS